MDVALLSNLIAGGLSSVIFSALQVPIDVVSQRLIVQDRAKGYKGALGTLRKGAKPDL